MRARACASTSRSRLVRHFKHHVTHHVTHAICTPYALVCPQDVSSVSGGGYLASSLLALQHAYRESHPRNKQGESTAPVEPRTGKVRLPGKVMFAYLSALQENVGIFVEGWSGRFFIDMAAFLWTLVELFIVNVLTCASRDSDGALRLPQLAALLRTHA